MKLYVGGHLDFYLPNRGNWAEIELKVPTRLNELLAGLGIPLAEINLVVINGQLVDLEEAFVGGDDQVKVYPPVSGG